jgi:hypothetical protein
MHEMRLHHRSQRHDCFFMMTGLFTSAQIEGDGDDTVLYPVNMERLAVLGSVSYLVG